MENPEAMLDVLSMQTFRQRFGPTPHHPGGHHGAFHGDGAGNGFLAPEPDDQLEKLVRNLCIDDSIATCFAESGSDDVSDVGEGDDVKVWLPSVKDHGHEETFDLTTLSKASHYSGDLDIPPMCDRSPGVNQFQQEDSPQAKWKKKDDHPPISHQSKNPPSGLRHTSVHIDNSGSNPQSDTQVSDADLCVGIGKEKTGGSGRRKELTFQTHFSPSEAQSTLPISYLEYENVRDGSFVSSKSDIVRESEAEMNQETPLNPPECVEYPNDALSIHPLRARCVDSQQKKSALQRMAEKARLRRKKNANSTTGRSLVSGSSNNNLKSSQSDISKNDSNERFLDQDNSIFNESNTLQLSAFDPHRRTCNQQEHQPFVYHSHEDSGSQGNLRTTSIENTSETATKTGNSERYSLPSSSFDFTTDGIDFIKSVPWYENQTIQCQELASRIAAGPGDDPLEPLEFHDAQNGMCIRAASKQRKFWYETETEDSIFSPQHRSKNENLTLTDLIEHSARVVTPESDVSKDEVTTDGKVTTATTPETEAISVSTSTVHMASPAGNNFAPHANSGKHLSSQVSAERDTSLSEDGRPLGSVKRRVRLDDHSHVYANCQIPTGPKEASFRSESISVSDQCSVDDIDSTIPLNDSANSRVCVQSLTSDDSTGDPQRLLEDCITTGDNERLRDAIRSHSFASLDWGHGNGTKAKSPFHLAIQLGRLECLRILLQNQTLMEQCGWHDGLHLDLATEAVRSNQVKSLLLVHHVTGLQAMSGPVDGEGNTLMHLAALLGHTDITVALISLGHDVNVENQSGVTPLQLCLQRSSSSKGLEDNNEKGIPGSEENPNPRGAYEGFTSTCKGTIQGCNNNSISNVNASVSKSSEASKRDNSVDKSDHTTDNEPTKSNVRSDGIGESNVQQACPRERDSERCDPSATHSDPSGTHSDPSVAHSVGKTEVTSLNNECFIGRVQISNDDIKPNPYSSLSHQSPTACFKPNSHDPKPATGTLFQEFLQWLAKQHKDNDQWLYSTLEKNQTKVGQDNTLADDCYKKTNSKDEEIVWTHKNARDLINYLYIDCKLDPHPESSLERRLMEYMKTAQQNLTTTSSLDVAENGNKGKERRGGPKPTNKNIGQGKMFSESSISSDSLESYSSSSGRDLGTNDWPESKGSDLHGHEIDMNLNSKERRDNDDSDEHTGKGVTSPSHNKCESVDNFCISSDELYNSPPDRSPSSSNKPRFSRQHSQLHSYIHERPTNPSRRTVVNVQADTKHNRPAARRNGIKYVEDTLSALDNLNADNAVVNDLKANSEILSLFLDSSSTSQDPNDDSQRDDSNDTSDEITRRQEARRRRRWGGLSLLPHHLKKKIERLSQKGKKKTGAISGSGISGSSNSNSNSSSSIITSSSSSGGGGGGGGVGGVGNGPLRGYHPDGNSSVRAMVDFRDDGQQFLLNHLRLQNQFQPMHERPTGSASNSTKFGRTTQDPADWWKLHLLSRRNQSKRRKELTKRRGFDEEEGVAGEDLEDDLFWSPVDSFSSMTPVSEDDESEITDSISDFSYDDESMSEYSDVHRGQSPQRCHQQHHHHHHHHHNLAHRLNHQISPERCHQSHPRHHHHRRHREIRYDRSPSRENRGHSDHGSGDNVYADDNDDVDDDDDDDDDSDESEDPRVRVNVENEDWSDEMLRAQRLARHFESVELLQSVDDPIVGPSIDGPDEAMMSQGHVGHEPSHVNIGEAYPFRSDAHGSRHHQGAPLRTEGTTMTLTSTGGGTGGKRSKVNLFNHEKLGRDEDVEKSKSQAKTANPIPAPVKGRHCEVDRRPPWQQLALSDSDDSDMGDINSR